MKIKSSRVAQTFVAMTAFGALFASAAALAEPVVSGRMFYDLTSKDISKTGATQNGSGVGIDVSRFYLTVDNKFTDIISGSVTLDFANTVSTTANNQVFVKKAFVNFNFDPKLQVSVGENDMPWVPYVEDLYGYRYLNTVMIDRASFGTSTDWGLFAKGNLNDYISYSVAAVNGSGYRRGIVRSAELDYEGRLSLKYNHIYASIGGHTGHLGAQKSSTNTFTAGSGTTAATGPTKTSTRSDALFGWKGDRLTAIVEGFQATNYAGSNPVAKTSATINTNEAEGISTFVNYRVTPQVTAFGRYDHVVTDNKNTTAADTKDVFYTAGASYTVFRNVEFALAYKKTNTKTVSGLVQTPTKTQEIGVWAYYRF